MAVAREAHGQFEPGAAKGTVGARELKRPFYCHFDASDMYMHNGEVL